MSDATFPDSWSICKFTEMLDVNGGTQPPKSEFLYEPKEAYVRLLQIRDFGKKPVPTYVPVAKKLRICTESDVLIGRYGASVGRICTGMGGAYNVALARVAKPDQFSAKYLKYYLISQYFQEPLSLISRSAQNGFNKDDLAEIDLYVAPENEQTRIANKLDELLAQVDTIKARIDAIPAILKRFRQSVLAAAVSGKLTEEWRSSNDVPEDSWQELTVMDVAKVLDPNPSHRYPKADKKGVPILSTQQFVGDSGWTTDRAKLVNRDFFEERSSKCGFFEKDIIFARKGRLGLPRFAPTGFDYVYSHTVFIIRSNDLISPEFLLMILRPDAVVENLLMIMNSNTGVPTLGKGVFETMNILVPTMEEQDYVVQRVEQFFTFADQIEQRVRVAQSRINNLTQSILAKAFRGELVPQDPNDEPASLLLERIKQEREVAAKLAKAVKKVGKKKVKA